MANARYKVDKIYPSWGGEFYTPKGTALVALDEDVMIMVVSPHNDGGYVWAIESEKGEFTNYSLFQSDHQKMSLAQSLANTLIKGQNSFRWHRIETLQGTVAHKMMYDNLKDEKPEIEGRLVPTPTPTAEGIAADVVRASCTGHSLRELMASIPPEPLAPLSPIVPHMSPEEYMKKLMGE